MNTESTSTESMMLDWHMYGYCMMEEPVDHFCFCDEGGAGTECTK